MKYLLLVLLLGSGQPRLSQVARDDQERAMYQLLELQRNEIADIWRPSRRLRLDFAKAEACYVRFHLGKVDSCGKQIDRVEADLQAAESEHH